MSDKLKIAGTTESVRVFESESDGSSWIRHVYWDNHNGQVLRHTSFYEMPNEKLAEWVAAALREYKTPEAKKEIEERFGERR